MFLSFTLLATRCPQGPVHKASSWTFERKAQLSTIELSGKGDSESLISSTVNRGVVCVAAGSVWKRTRVCLWKRSLSTNF